MVEPILAALILAPLAQIDTYAELAPYIALVAGGFLVGAWGTAAKVPLAVVLGIAMIAGGVLLLQTRQDDFGGLPPPCEQPPCPE